MRSLLPYILKYWKPASFAILCLVFEAVCDLLQPTIMAHIVDVGIAKKDMHLVLVLAGVMLLITAAGALSAVGRNVVSSLTSTRIGADLRSGLFRSVQSFSFKTIDKFETGSLVTRLTSDVTQVQQFVHGFMRIFAKAPIMAAGSIVMAVSLNPRMSLVFLAVIPLIILVITVNLRLGTPLFLKVQKALDRVNAVTQEYLAGVRVVKAFNRFDYERKRFDAASGGLASVTIRAMRVMAFFGPGIGLAMNLGIIGVLWYGGWQVELGRVKVGQIIAFTNYMSQMLFALMVISMVVTTFSRARASGDRIAEVLSEKQTEPFITARAVLPPAIRGVSFEKVFFDYEGKAAAPVLSDISFSAAAGETIGIIGSTGSGKTSLVYLLPRFYDVLSGSVKVGGTDIREIDRQALRSAIAVVPQKTTLFTGTIFDNILWGRKEASREEVEKAARIALAHDFIMSFPEKYDTRLGQGGVNLSGGQKQRISIARALVKNPAILILDDCTSSVDTTTEAGIRSGLSEYMKGMTTFFISQRVMSVMRCDRILVLDDGAVAGLGTHEELMAGCGVYRDIHRSQIGTDSQHD